MNTLVFLCGAGLGALIATLMLVFVMGLRSKKPNSSDAVEARIKQVHEMELRNLAELKRRNDIGDDQASSLKTIAQWCDKNWKQ